MLKTRLFRTLPLAALGMAALALPACADRGRYHDSSYRGGGSGAVLYSDSGFSGEGLRIHGAEPDLARLRFNDRASSIVIQSGAWELCTDANFRGRCEIVDVSTDRLNAYRLNDNVSSPSHLSRQRAWQQPGPSGRLECRPRPVPGFRSARAGNRGPAGYSRPQPIPLQ